jgi:hypothetical protein
MMNTLRLRLIRFLKRKKAIKQEIFEGSAPAGDAKKEVQAFSVIIWQHYKTDNVGRRGGYYTPL